MTLDLINLTFAVLSAALAAVAIYGLRGRPPGAALAAIRRLAGSSGILFLLIAGNSLIVGFHLYMSYVAPTNIMQDVVSARQYLDGKPLYPSNMGPLMHDALRADPPRFSLGKWFPRLKAKEDREQLSAGITVVQAHPPLMTLFFAPLVKVAGMRGACLLFGLLSLGALFLTNHAIFRGLELPLSRRERTALSFGILGWYPVLSTFRWGQAGIVLGALIVGAWFALRRERPVLAGILIATATCLKMFPGLLLVYFFFRFRRAFVAGAVSVAVLTFVSAAIAGWQNYRDYSAAAHFVLMRFGGLRHNLSLLAIVVRRIGARVNPSLYQTTPAAIAIFTGLALLLIGILLWLLLRNSATPADARRRIDVEYSLTAALLPLLSPLSWDHYMCVLLLPILFLCRRVLAGEPAMRRLLGLAALMAALSIPAWTFHVNTPVVPATAAMLALWCWIAKDYRHSQQPAPTRGAFKTALPV